MIAESTPRHSDVAYVLAKLRVGAEDYALLRAHTKWGDWSLVGGHVEPTDQTWHAAARREVEEEMAPLRCGRDFEVEPLDVPASKWGPVPSRSAGMRPTNYRAEWYVLRFVADPRQCLAKLPPDAFRLVRLSDLHHVPNLSSIVERVASLLPRGWESLPLSWPLNLDRLPFERLTLAADPPSRRVLNG